MRLVYVIVLFLGFTSSIYMEICPPPEDISPCSCKQGWKDQIIIFCQRNSDLETLKQALSSLHGKNTVQIFFTHIKISTLPSNFFNGIGIKWLYFQDCDLDSLSNDNQPQLQGLENYLEVLHITNSFTEENVPAKLSLGHLKNLKDLRISDNTISELGDDCFSNGPTSLGILIISNNGIKNIGNNAFAELNNLKLLDLSGNRFDSINRSMFPTAADRLVVLKLENNELTYLPEDIFSRMPSLKVISLKNNGITTLDQRTWFFIWQQLVEINLDGNNMHCDDRLNWIIKSKVVPKFTYGICSSPGELKGLLLSLFFEGRTH